MIQTHLSSSISPGPSYESDFPFSTGAIPTHQCNVQTLKLLIPQQLLSPTVQFSVTLTNTHKHKNPVQLHSSNSPLAANAPIDSMISGVDAGGNSHLFNSSCALIEIDRMHSLYKLMTYTDTTGEPSQHGPPGDIDSLFIDHAQGLKVPLSLSLWPLRQRVFTLIIAVFHSLDIC